jgi:riboflavin kinase
MLTDKGASLLKKHYLELKRLFEGERAGSLRGRVKAGLGEGAYYVSQPRYAKQFRRKLGFKPFPGTLNLVVDEGSLADFLSNLRETKIGGFQTKKRSFGSITAFRVLVGRAQEAAIIFPERSSKPKNQIEVIAPVSLRRKFRLKEGSALELFAREGVEAGV